MNVSEEMIELRNNQLRIDEIEQEISYRTNNFKKSLEPLESEKTKLQEYVSSKSNKYVDIRLNDFIYELCSVLGSKKENIKINARAIENSFNPYDDEKVTIVIDITNKNFGDDFNYSFMFNVNYDSIMTDGKSIYDHLFIKEENGLVIDEYKPLTHFVTLPYENIYLPIKIYSDIKNNYICGMNYVAYVNPFDAYYQAAINCIKKYEQEKGFQRNLIQKNK